MARLINTDLDFNSVAKAINLPAPTNPGDAVPMSYVDALVQGLAWKDSARVASSSNINLTSPGATIDAVTMVSGDRVLIKSQTATTENGVYIWNGSAVAMTRSLDADTFNELEMAIITVEEGTSAAATLRQSAVNGVIGTNAVTWVAFGSSAPASNEITAGIAQVATQAETDAGVIDTDMVTPLKLATYAGRAKRYASTFGDGAATSYVITHNLGTTDVQVFIQETGGSKRQIDAEIQITSTNSVTIITKTAPASNAYRVVIVA